MLTGVELILKRMETHPEEFVGVNGGCSREWHAVITPVSPYLTDDEREALNKALVQAYRDHFNAQTLKKIAGESVLSDRERQRLDDYDYGGVSLMDRLNGTEARTLKEAAMLRPVKTAAAMPLVGTLTSNHATQPSAFGAVPMKAEGQMVEYQK